MKYQALRPHVFSVDGVQVSGVGGGMGMVGYGVGVLG